jgi:PAS domain S-box-containing protein
MPQFDAFRALALLKQSTLDVPFIVVSGTLGETTAVELMREGATDYLLKDRLTRLGPAVTRAIGEHRLRQESRRVEQIARESVEKFQRIFQQTLDAIVIHRCRDGHVVEANPEFLEMSGFTRAEVMGNPLSELDLWSDPGELERVLGEAEESGFVRDREMEFRTKDGECRTVLYSAVTVDVDGERCLLSIVRDITERKQAERELQAALARAQESDRLKNAFLANMSHEIRTPLNVILGYSALVAEELADMAITSLDPMIDGVKRASKRLLNTIHAVLDLARIQTGIFETKPATLHPAAVLRKIEAEFEATAVEKGLTLSCEVADPSLTVVFDEYCLSAALRQLVDNAIKFTERGVVSMSLQRDRSGAVSLRISDTGIGIERSYLPHLFDQFSQEQMGYTRKFEGSGIGLTLVKWYVEANGAALTVDSEKGKGAAFAIHCPAGEVVPAGGPSCAGRGTACGGIP